MLVHITYAVIQICIVIYMKKYFYLRRKGQWYFGTFKRMEFWLHIFFFFIKNLLNCLQECIN